MDKIDDYVGRIVASNSIDGELYEKYNVKRGLRNADGTGVLVGLTRIGDVHGYIMDEGERIAIDGKLYYRGVDVEELVLHAVMEDRLAYEEAVYLLLFGELPDKERLAGFSAFLGQNRVLPPNFAEDSIMKMPSRDIMNELAHSVLSLYSWDSDPENFEPGNILRQCLELIARFPTIVAYAYRAKRHYFDQKSLIIHQVDTTLSTAETVLSLCRQDKKYTRLEAELLDLALVLHAEHGGGNNSTFAVHLVSSADTDTYSAIAAALGSLKGRKHGGANAKVMEMMEDIKSGVRDWACEKEVAAYLEKILRRQAGDGSGLIYGQGHAVYTKSDPRATLLREKAAILASEIGLDDEFNLYRSIERLTPEVMRRVKGRETEICANVDFYSGFVYKMLGIPPELYTPIFAVSRVAGWCAHRLEEVISGGRIIRPAYKCVQRHAAYVPVFEREGAAGARSAGGAA